MGVTMMTIVLIVMMVLSRQQSTMEKLSAPLWLDALTAEIRQLMLQQIAINPAMTASLMVIVKYQVAQPTLCAAMAAPRLTDVARHAMMAQPLPTAPTALLVMMVQQLHKRATALRHAVMELPLPTALPAKIALTALATLQLTLLAQPTQRAIMAKHRLTDAARLAPMAPPPPMKSLASHAMMA